MPNKGPVTRLPDYVLDYAKREAALEGRRPSDVVAQIVRLGLEARESRKVDTERAKRVIDAIKAVV